MAVVDIIRRQLGWEQPQLPRLAWNQSKNRRHVDMKLWPLTVSFIDDYAEATEVHCCLWRSTLPPWSRCLASLHRSSLIALVPSRCLRPLFLTNPFPWLCFRQFINLTSLLVPFPIFPYLKIEGTSATDHYSHMFFRVGCLSIVQLPLAPK